MRSPRTRFSLIRNYIIYCVAILIVIVIILSTLIRQNNIKQTTNTLGMMAEKVNISFDIMVANVEYLADMLSARENLNFTSAYTELRKSLSTNRFFSIGIITNDGLIYGKPGEQLDLKKQDLYKNNSSINKPYVTEPYRSSMTGSNVITILAPIYQENEQVASLYVTYLLESLQDIANTDVEKYATETFLMNCYSGNYVTCTPSNDRPTGTWSNVRLMKNQIKSLKGYSFDTWEKNMQNNDTENNIFCYELDGVAYTQAYIAVANMENWYILVRIPNKVLSAATSQYLISLTICFTFLLLGTVYFAGRMLWIEYLQKRDLQQISSLDHLTQLLNRRSFEEKLTHLFAIRSDDISYTYMYIDIDDFKNINDGYGHDAGDQVLIHVANSLKQVFSPHGYVARFGGDEFNIIINQPLSVEDIDGLMAVLRMNLNNTVLPDGTTLNVHTSAGLAQYPSDAAELTELRENADKALYYVKEHGKNNHYWFKDLRK